MQSSPTLQDFVLNLIYDPVARSQFEVDPQGTLADAGLGDVTAADVREVIPLVIDYAPLGGAPTLAGPAGVDDLSTGVANLDVAGAVAHLQAITGQVAGNATQVGGDLNVAAAVTVTAGGPVSGLLGGGLSLHDGSLLGQAGLSADHDPAASLDAGAGAEAGVGAGVSDVVTGVDGVVSHTAPVTTGVLDGGVNTVTGLPGSLGIDHGLGLDVPGLHEATSSVIGSLPGSDATGGLLPDLTHPDSVTGQLEHHVSGVTDLLGGVTHPTTEPEAGHDILGGLVDPHF